MSDAATHFGARATRPHVDVGLLALQHIAKHYQIGADPDSLAHELGLAGRGSTMNDLVKGAFKLGLKAKILRNQDPLRINTLPRPAILQMNDGAYFILGQTPDGADTLRDPLDIKARRISSGQIANQWTGEVILITKRATIDEESEGFGFSWFLAAASRYKATIIHILICSFFIQVFALVTPLFFQVIVDKVLVHKAISTLYVIIAALVTIGVFDVGLQYLRSYALYHTASRIDVDLGAQMFRRLFRLPVSYFETRPTGQTVARVRQIETIRTFLTGQALTSIIDTLFALIFFAVLFYYSVTLALIVLCSIPLYLLTISIIRPRLRTKIREKFNRNAMSQQYLVESVVGALTLKAAAVEPLLQNQWEERLAAYVKTSFQAVMLGTGGQVLVQLISKLTTAAILLFGTKSVIDGEMTVGQLIAFNMISAQVAQPIMRLSQLWQDLQQVQISIDRLGDIFNHPAEEYTSSSMRAPNRELGGSIRFESVTFRYRPGTGPALSDITLDIPQGQVIGIVGQSGSGKSTFTKLIQRLYQPEQGRVLIDGIDVAQIPPFWFRRQIGVVLQENILFNRTVHENIALANPAMSRGNVIKVASLAGADEFIQRLPQGYDTVIHERGANLSGGQRQRIAIARALARKPRILIFDEATSALDYESEQIIQANMRNIVRGRTVVIVAHRLAAVRNCDRIISMEEGRIIEDGKPNELLKRKDGLYYKLSSLQSATSQPVSAP